MSLQPKNNPERKQKLTLTKKDIPPALLLSQLPGNKIKLVCHSCFFTVREQIDSESYWPHISSCQDILS